MAELSLIKIWELPKTSWYDGLTCAIPEELRDWLPSTQYDQTSGRITVRSPYPIGDYDNYMALSNEDKTCSHCSGTGVNPDGTKCAVCNGTGIPCESIGATMDDAGVIHLQIDRATLGIDQDGRLYARFKLADKGGLDLNGDDQVYVKVDDKTIKIGSDGSLYAVTVRPFSTDTSGPVRNGSALICKIDEETVKKVQVHVAISFNNALHYMDAHELTRFAVNITALSSGSTRQVSIPHNCWDQTSPYSTLHFDAFIDVANYPTNIMLTMTTEESDTFGAADITFVAHVVSC